LGTLGRQGIRGKDWIVVMLIENALYLAVVMEFAKMVFANVIMDTKEIHVNNLSLLAMAAFMEFAWKILIKHNLFVNVSLDLLDHIVLFMIVQKILVHMNNFVVDMVFVHLMEQKNVNVMVDFLVMIVVL